MQSPRNFRSSYYTVFAMRSRGMRSANEGHRLLKKSFHRGNPGPGAASRHSLITYWPQPARSPLQLGPRLLLQAFENREHTHSRIRPRHDTDGPNSLPELG